MLQIYQGCIKLGQNSSKLDKSMCTETGLKKSQICPIWGQSDLIWSKPNILNDCTHWCRCGAWRRSPGRCRLSWPGWDSWRGERQIPCCLPSTPAIHPGNRPLCPTAACCLQENTGHSQGLWKTTAKRPGPVKILKNVLANLAVVFQNLQAQQHFQGFYATMIFS